MATPSSSATSPSPPMAYLQHVPVAPQATASSSSEPVEREKRKQAVQKFLARAELSNFTRALRTRLSYASFKTTHNATSVPLSDLEAQAQLLSPTTLSSRSSAAKRKAPGNSNNYNHPATQPTGNMVASPLRRGSLGPMAPPAPLGGRSSHPSINGNVGTSSGIVEPPRSPKAQTLFSSILAPPPANQARTILNASDPPVAAPVRPAMSPRVRNTKVTRSIAEGTRAQAKSRRADPTKADRSGKRTADKGKRKRAQGVDADGDVDMEAAATLTSLLLHHRPSMAGSASSPRSSVDGSEAGSTYSQRPRSSSRTFPLGAPAISGAVPPSSAPSSVASTSYRSSTPPPGSKTPAQQTTPRPAPTDNEAADLMLFLATSPSPARPSNKDAKDAAAFRALVNHTGVMRAKPRVLFSTHSGDTTPDEPGSSTPRGSALLRGGEGSFNSSISSIGSDMGQRQPTAERPSSKLAEGSLRPSSPSVRGPHSGQNLPSSQLLPPPSLPASSFPTNYPSSPSGLRKEASPHPSSGADFNFNDYIHASPSPSRGSGTGQGPKMNLGLRADVGRKLFEEEQMRMGANLGSQHHGDRPDDRSLEAGIDLVKT